MHSRDDIDIGKNGIYCIYYYLSKEAAMKKTNAKPSTPAVSAPTSDSSQPAKTASPIAAPDLSAAKVAVETVPTAPLAQAAALPASNVAGKKKKKAKVVRDSFTMPESDYAKIAELKKKSLEAGISIKKGELLRAGLHALEALSIDQLKALLGGVENIKTGRPTTEQSTDTTSVKSAA